MVDKKETIHRKFLAKSASNAIGISMRESNELIDSLFDILGSGLKNDGVVKIPRFGCFLINYNAERVGRNPRTGEKITIPSKKNVYLRYSNLLRKKM